MKFGCILEAYVKTGVPSINHYIANCRSSSEEGGLSNEGLELK